MASLKEVTVSYGPKKKLVNIDPKSFEKTIEIIQTRLQLTQKISLQAISGEKGGFYDIDDDQDLVRFKDCNNFVVHLSEVAEESFAYGSPQGPSSLGLPPAYEQSVQPPPEAPAQVPKPPEKKLTVTYKERKKSVGIDCTSVETTKAVIRQRFNIEGDFIVQAKHAGSDDVFAIETEEDIDDLVGAESLSISERDQRCEVYREKPVVVEIDGGMYPVNAAPPSNSNVVRREMIDLASNFDIPGIIRQIDIVAMCMRIALYGVIGKRHLELKVVEMQAKVDNLCNMSAKAVKQYGMKTRDILSEMKYAIGCLNEGYEGMASDHFKNVVKTSDELKETSANLREFLEELQTFVQDVCGEVTKENSAHTQENAALSADLNSDRRKLLEKRKQQAALDREEVEARLKDMATGDDLQRAKAVLDHHKGGDCTCGKDECCRNCCSGSFLLCRHTHRYHCVNSKKTEMLQYVVDSECHLLDRERLGRVQALEEREQVRKAEEEAIEELLKFTEALKKDDPARDPRDSIQDALRGAETGLRTLRSAVQRIINFWDDLRVQSESVATVGGGSFGQIEKQMDEEQKEKFFKSRVFQVGTVEYLGKWVALRMMCEAFTESMEPIQRNLQSSIADNPSRKEALQRIPDLILTLEKKVAERRDTIHVDQEADAELLKSLMAGAVNINNID